MACHSRSLTELPRAARFTKGIIRLVGGRIPTKRCARRIISRNESARFVIDL